MFLAIDSRINRLGVNTLAYEPFGFILARVKGRRPIGLKVDSLGNDRFILRVKRPEGERAYQQIITKNNLESQEVDAFLRTILR
jgi:hypothetical protein